MLSIPKYPEQYAQHFRTIFYLLCCASQHHVRLAEKMAIIPTIVVPADWMFAESLERLRISRNPRNIRWAEGDVICRITKRKHTWE